MKKRAIIFCSLIMLLCSACEREETEQILTERVIDIPVVTSEVIETSVPITTTTEPTTTTVSEEWLTEIRTKVTEKEPAVQEATNTVTVTEVTTTEVATTTTTKVTALTNADGLELPDWDDDDWDFDDEEPVSVKDKRHTELVKLPTPSKKTEIEGYIYPKFTRTPFKEKVTNAHKEKDYRGYLYSYALMNLTKSERTAFKIICDGVSSYAEEVVIGDYKVTQDVYLRMLKYLQVDCPDSWVLGSTITTQNTYLQGKYVNAVKFSYAVTEEEYLEYTQKLLELGASLRSVMPKDATDYEKYLYIHDFLIANIEYANGVPYEKNVIGALIKGKCSCMGFTEAFTFLCREFDLLPTVGLGDLVQGDVGSVGHIWSIAPYAGGYMIIDCTSDNKDRYSSYGQEVISETYMGITENKGVGAVLVRDKEGEPEYYPSPVADLEGYNYSSLNIFDKEPTPENLFDELYVQFTDPDSKNICILSFNSVDERDAIYRKISLNMPMICIMFQEKGYDVETISAWGGESDTMLYLFM